jgi:hypothetical protein
MKWTRLASAAAFAFLAGSSAQALTVSVTGSAGTADGVVVEITILGEGSSSDAGGYALVFEYDVAAPIATASSTAAPDPNAQFGESASCNTGAQNCTGANGGAFGTFVISDSVSTFTLTGFAPGGFTYIHWTTENSIGLSAASSLPSGVVGIPEPSTAGLVILGLTGLAIRERRRCR